MKRTRGYEAPDSHTTCPLLTMNRLFQLFLACLLVLAGGCSSDPHPPSATSDAGTSVWAVDLVRTLPGAQADYLRSIETNWANARRIARHRGAVRSYQAFAAPPDTLRPWDVILMTEYVDSSAWAQREETFQAIFASPEFVAVEPARPSAEMREFVQGDVAMRALSIDP